MTRSEIFRNNYKQQKESEKEDKSKIAKFVLAEAKTKSEDLSNKRNNSNQQER